MSLADIKKKKEANKPKGLASLKKSKPVGLAGLKKDKPSGLAGLKKKQSHSMKLNTKQDFLREGIKFHNCIYRGPGEPMCYMGKKDAFWSVDVSNGLQSYTFHNRWGSWMSGGVDKSGDALPGEITEKGGGISPPAFVAAGCRDRYMAELKARKLPDMQKLRAIREEEEKQKIKARLESERIAKAREQRRANKAKNKTTKTKSKAKGLAAMKGKK